MYRKSLTETWPFGLGDVLTTFTQDANVKANISETDKAYNILIFAPGRQKSDFKVGIENGVLSISANAKNEKVNWLREEYYFGSFVRKFTIKDSVDTKNVTAKYENGVLEITLNKIEEKSTTREIEVK